MSISIDFLVVAGGGSGGNHNTTNANGGGGGGGILNAISLVPGGGTYAITIGAGGAAVASATTGTGNKGTNSSFGSTWVAQGGGGGTSSGVSFNTAVNSGGSGGGYSQPNGAGTSGGGSATQTSIAGATGYGNPGGSSAVAWSGAGGGGAGSAGVSGSGSAPGCNGGAGFITSISGASKGYAGGGGGGGNSSERAGDGYHGGGRGAGTTTYYSYNVYTNEINSTTLGSGIPTAVVNSGGGGGGGSYWAPNGGWSTGSGQGGSGIVIIRTADTAPVFATTGSPTITVAGGYRVYTFTSSGSITTGPSNTVAPVISGTSAIGTTLTTTLGTWTSSGTITYSYQWARDGINISGATSSTYTTVSADGDTTITCIVTATDTSGSSTAVSNGIFILSPTSAYIEYLMVGGGGGGGGNQGGGGGAGGVLLASTDASSSSGQNTYTTPGTYSWTAPTGVTSVSVVAVGGGGGGGQTWSSGGGGGGGLGYKTAIAVVPGQSYTVVVGAGGISLANATTVGAEGGNSYFISLETVAGYGSGRGGPGSTAATPAYGGGYTGTGGGRGGNGATDGNWQKAGAGAGGYAGQGADSGAATGTAAPAGGGGGAGGYYSSTYGQPGGGGVGILGQGASGASTGNAFSGGRGGSGGQNGADGEPNSNTSVKGMIYGGAYGGGGGGSGTSTGGGPGGSGAVRIIWGTERSYPAGAQDIFTPSPVLFVSKGIYNITVGSGGAGALAGSSPAAGSNGGNTVFGSIIAYGGGGGGSSTAGAKSGGSGGGGSGQTSGFAAGTSLSSQGRSGGTGLLNYPGGGGGANGAGSTTPGNGGAGIASSILGTSYYWGGGGGGAGYTGNAGIGGLGGGGGGAPKVSGGGTAGTGGINTGTDGGVGTLSNAAANAPGGGGGTNTGGGGGGGSAGTVTNGGGQGGSGIVVIRYPDSYYPAVAAVNVDAGYPIVSGGYRLYKWSSSGAIQLGAPGTPVNTVVPSVSVLSGSVTNGLPDAVLLCNVGTWTGDATIVYTYQWTVNSININGATSSTYTTILTDGFKTISCIVTATNSVDSITIAASNGLFILINGFVSVSTELGFGPGQTILPVNSIESTLAESATTAVSVNGGVVSDMVNTSQVTVAATTYAATDGTPITAGATVTNQQYWS